MNPLQQIPATVRLALYWTGYVVGVVGQGTTIVWASIAAASPDIEMPLGLVITSGVIALLQTQLNLLSSSNTTTEPQVDEAVVVAQLEAGQVVAGPASEQPNGTPLNVAPKLL